MEVLLKLLQLIRQMAGLAYALLNKTSGDYLPDTASRRKGRVRRSV